MLVVIVLSTQKSQNTGGGRNRLLEGKNVFLFPGSYYFGRLFKHKHEYVHIVDSINAAVAQHFSITTKKA